MLRQMSNDKIQYCLYCNLPFYQNFHNRKYCSKQCQHKDYYRKHPEKYNKDSYSKRYDKEILTIKKIFADFLYNLALNHYYLSKPFIKQEFSSFMKRSFTDLRLFRRELTKACNSYIVQYNTNSYKSIIIKRDDDFWKN